MNDPERRVAILHAVGDQAEGDEVVDLIELNPLALQFLVDAVEPLQAAIDADDGNLRFAELGRDGLFEILDFNLGGLPAAFDFRGEHAISLHVEIFERQLFELVLHLAHAKPVGDRRVDVEGLLRGLLLAVFRHMFERAHIVKAIGELHENHADIVDHREQHFAEAFGLPLFARRKRDGADRADFRDPFDDVRDLGAEVLLNLLDRRQGIFDNVVQQARGDRDRIEPHLRKDAGHLQWMDQVGLS